MKKLFLVGALALFASMNAQQFGIKAGMNISSLNGDVENVKSKVGFSAGVFAQFPISSQFTFQPEVLYSGQGAKGKEDGFEATWSIDYIAVPLMFKYNLAEKFSLEAGPQIGFLMSSKLKGDGESVDIKDEMKSTDFAINLGANYDIMPNLFIGARYSAGLTNIIKDSDDFKVRNNVFSVSLGYKF